ncbi:MAG: pyridoxamine 5'-phosphate oxidase family protein [Bacteroidales bacterium]
MDQDFPKQIVRFIEKHHVLTLATVKDGVPWCSNLFYAFVPSGNMLVFTSDPSTRHMNEGLANKRVAGSIVLETSIVGKIQGIQFEGVLEKPADKLETELRSAYLRRFPFAVLLDSQLWYIELQHIKLTDNRLGFGKKLLWNKNQPGGSVI